MYDTSCLFQWDYVYYGNNTDRTKMSYACTKAGIIWQNQTISLYLLIPWKYGERLKIYGKDWSAIKYITPHWNISRYNFLADFELSQWPISDGRYTDIQNAVDTNLKLHCWF